MSRVLVTGRRPRARRRRASRSSPLHHRGGAWGCVARHASIAVNDSWPLAGTSVVDLSTGLAGAYCTKLLADGGADVVKVEDPDG